MKLDNGSTFTASVLAVGMFQVASLYEQSAPSLTELRDAGPNDVRARQQLLDANIEVGLIVAAVSLIACYATDSYTPALIFLSAFSFMALWRQLVLNSPTHLQGILR